jgi:hypothetical protein
MKAYRGVEVWLHGLSLEKEHRSPFNMKTVTSEFSSQTLPIHALLSR